MKDVVERPKPKQLRQCIPKDNNDATWWKFCYGTLSRKPKVEDEEDGDGEEKEVVSKIPPTEPSPDLIGSFTQVQASSGPSS
jgi:hypothetical protein